MSTMRKTAVTQDICLWFMGAQTAKKDKPLKLESTSYYSKVSLDLGFNPISVQAHKGRT